MNYELTKIISRGVGENFCKKHNLKQKNKKYSYYESALFSKHIDVYSNKLSRSVTINTIIESYGEAGLIDKVKNSKIVNNIKDFIVKIYKKIVEIYKSIRAVFKRYKNLIDKNTHKLAYLIKSYDKLIPKLPETVDEPFTIPINIAEHYVELQKQKRVSKGGLDDAKNGYKYSSFDWDFELIPNEYNSRMIHILESSDGLLSDHFLKQLDRLSVGDDNRENDLKEWKSKAVKGMAILGKQTVEETQPKQYAEQCRKYTMKFMHLLDAQLKQVEEQERNNAWLDEWAQKMVTVLVDHPDLEKDELMKRNLDAANRIQKMALFNMNSSKTYSKVYNDFATLAISNGMTIISELRRFVPKEEKTKETKE